MNNSLLIGNIHCVKKAYIWRFSGPHFTAFGLNTERFGVCQKLANCMNESIKKNEFSNKLKAADITPIFKKTTH